MAKVFAFTLLRPGTPEAPPLGTALRLPLPSAFVCLFHGRCPPHTNRLSPRGKAWLLKPSVRRASRLSRVRRSPAPGMQLVPGVQTCQHPQRLCTGVTLHSPGPREGTMGTSSQPCCLHEAGADKCQRRMNE